MTMRTSGRVSSSIWWPSSRMAAILASSCLKSSLGGYVKNCGAWTVAPAATICPMGAPYSCEGIRHLGIETLVRLGKLDFAAPRVADRLDAAALPEVGIVIHQMLLGGHGLHRLEFLLPHRGDVEQHLRFEVALLGLV